MLNSPLYNLPHGGHSMHSMMSHSSGPYVVAGGGVSVVTQMTGLGMGISSQFSAAGLKADGSSNSTMLMNDGPPTPTQELDNMSGDHRKSELYISSVFFWSYENILLIFYFPISSGRFIGIVKQSTGCGNVNANITKPRTEFNAESGKLFPGRFDCTRYELAG